MPLETAAAAMAEKAAALEQSGVEVAFAGDLFQDVEIPASEVVGLLAAAVILLVAFGSVVAMGLPIVTALVGVVASIAALGLWSAVVPTPDFTTQVAMMIGIGVGIDYALFIVTRYRTALRRGLDPHAATVEALGTAGRAVVFAGGTVMISLLGLLLMRLSFLQGLALGTSTAVLVAVAAAITCCRHSSAWPGVASTASACIAGVAMSEAGSLAHRWAWGTAAPGRRRRRRDSGPAGPRRPVVSMRLAVADAGNDPAGTTTRQAYDWLADGFGAGVNGPLTLVMETPDASAASSA